MKVETPPLASHSRMRRFSATAGAPFLTRASGGTARTDAARSAGVTASVFIFVVSWGSEAEGTRVNQSPAHGNRPAIDAAGAPSDKAAAFKDALSRGTRQKM